MSEQKPVLLADLVKITGQYQRSARVDSDIENADAVSKYICHKTASGVINSIVKLITETSHRGITLTGPYGTGKSSLAVAIAGSLGTDKIIRTQARKSLGLTTGCEFDRALHVNKGWSVIPVVGRRGSVIAEIHSSLHKVVGASVKKRAKPSAKALIEELVTLAEQQPKDGVLLLIDEMGKFLEASAIGAGDDVYFFQELAEAASRSKGKLIVLGILHQAFTQYSTKLGIEGREDWAKVQGRYFDIPFVSTSDEVVELIARAIEAKKRPEWADEPAQTIATIMRQQRPTIGLSFDKTLASCWPLHPAMAALLGPVSRRQFGQNERSIFGFLTSVESFGFRSYLNTTRQEDATWYMPSDFWGYMQSNQEPAILASPDGHRWSQAVEAVNRTEAKTNDPFLISLIKNIAILDFFRNGSSVPANLSVLQSLYYNLSESDLIEALTKLSALKVVIYKSYTGSWSIFEGSDFDIDGAIAEVRSTLTGVDHSVLAQLLSLQPIVAKRHYHETGAMRWMDLILCNVEQAEKISETNIPSKGSFGTFLLVLPERGLTARNVKTRVENCARTNPWPIVTGYPANHDRITDLALDFIALEQVKLRHELSGDGVARREVFARIANVRATLEDQLQSAISQTKWFTGNDNRQLSESRLSPLASELADIVYCDSPRVWSELVSRDNLSTSSVKARRDLLYAMLSHESEAALGFNGFPAERGLYETVLNETGLHLPDENGEWRFVSPDDAGEGNFALLWSATKMMFEHANVPVNVEEIYSRWYDKPFGLKKGLHPIIFLAFVLANKASLAVYKDGMFVPHITEFDIDECLQQPSRFSLRWITVDSEKTQILSGISKLLTQVGQESCSADPLEAARGLVTLVFNLPHWARRTQKLDETTRAVRDLLLKASDPHKVLFVDLPALLNAKDTKSYVKALEHPIRELATAFDRMLREMEETLLEALDAEKNDFESLRKRAAAVAGVTGDMLLDAFVARLTKYDGNLSLLAEIAGLAAERTPADWVDRNIDEATLKLVKLSRNFREAEAFVSVKGRTPQFEAIAVVIGTGRNTKTMSRSFVISDKQRQTVENAAEQVADILKKQELDTDVLLAILAKAGMKLTSVAEG